MASMAYTRKGRSVDTRNDHRHALTCVEGVLPKLFNKFHKITLNKGDLFLKASFSSEFPRSLDLEVVIIQADNIGIGKLGNLASGSTNTAADIEDAHS